MSPLTTTGMRTAALTRRTKAQSAMPLKNWQRVRAWTVMSCTPAASARRASSGALQVRGIPAAAHLQGHGHADGPDDRLDQAHGVVEVAHQRRAGQLARDLAGRAAHVDVDDVGAQLFRHARPFRHPARLAARQLYDERSKIPANCPFAHAVTVLDQVLARHHLRGDEGGAQKMRLAAERQVGHARHRRQQHVAGQRVPADANVPHHRRRGGRTCAVAHLLGSFSCCTTLVQTTAPSTLSQVRSALYAGIVRMLLASLGRDKPNP